MNRQDQRVRIHIVGSSIILFAATVTGMPTSSAHAQGVDPKVVWVDGSAGRSRVSDGGDGGAPVVFVHALAGNLSQWSNQLSHLRRSRRALALDLRGHGESDKPAGVDYSLDGAASDIESVVDRLGLDEFVLVGHSFGGGAIAVYAGRHPDRVKGLIFVDPIGDQRPVRMQIDALLQLLDSPSFRNTARAYYEGILYNSVPGVKDKVIEALMETPQEAVIGAFRSVAEFDPLTALRPFTGPMISIISDLNNFPTSLHNVLPNLPSQLVSGTSHWLQMDSPDEFNDHLDRFLASVR